MEEKKPDQSSDINQRIAFFKQLESFPSRPSSTKRQSPTGLNITEVKDDSIKQQKKFVGIEQQINRMSISQDLIVSTPSVSNSPSTSKKRADSFLTIKEKFKKSLSGTSFNSKNEKSDASPNAGIEEHSPLLRKRSQTLTAKKVSPQNIEQPTLFLQESLLQRERELNILHAELKEMKEQLQKKDALQKSADMNLEKKYKELSKQMEEKRKASLYLKEEITQTEKMKKELYEDQAKILFDAYSDNKLEKLHKLFMEGKYSPDHRIREGKTLLHIAAEDQRHDFVKLMINIYNANPNIKDASGSLPLHYAATHHDFEIARALLWKEDTCISNALTKNTKMKSPRECLQADHPNFSMLNALLVDAERDADVISLKVLKNVEEEFATLAAAKDRIVYAFKSGKELQPGLELTTLNFINDTIQGMKRNIEKTILLDEEKKDILTRVSSFHVDLQQEISMKRLPIIKNKEPSSPTSSSKKPGFFEKFNFLNRKPDSKESSNKNYSPTSSTREFK